MNILDTLIAASRERVENSKKLISADEMKYMALSMQDDTFDFETALSKKGLSFIAECKKGMPITGVFPTGHHYIELANDFENAGADCISVVTEPNYFLGCRDHLRIVVNEVSVPCLRREAIIDEYMIYETKIIGAKAVMMIPGLLNDDELCADAERKYGAITTKCILYRGADQDLPNGIIYRNVEKWLKQR